MQSPAAPASMTLRHGHERALYGLGRTVLPDASCSDVARWREYVCAGECEMDPVPHARSGHGVYAPFRLSAAVR